MTKATTSQSVSHTDFELCKEQCTHYMALNQIKSPIIQ